MYYINVYICIKAHAKYMEVFNRALGDTLVNVKCLLFCLFSMLPFVTFHGKIVIHWIQAYTYVRSTVRRQKNVTYSGLKVYALSILTVHDLGNLGH